MTLRQIYEMIKTDGEEFLDAELTINVRGNKVAFAVPARDLWGFPRQTSCKQTGEPARLSMDVYLHPKYMISERKQK